MDTRQVAREVRLTQWAGIPRERRDSGLSVRSYCLKQGINEKTYYYWQRRLRETACEGMVIEKDHTFLPCAHEESPIFAALPMSGSKNSGSIVVRLNGAEVESCGGADPAAIDTVLRILRGFYGISPAPSISMWPAIHRSAQIHRRTVSIGTQRFQLDPSSNALFLFCGRRCDRLKALYWEGGGFVLLYKRLEQGWLWWTIFAAATNAPSVKKKAEKL